MPAALGESFLGAIQASLSVVIVIAAGCAAARLKLLDPKSSKAISKVSVRMLLPALLITKIGSQLNIDSIGSYGIILAWGIVCHAVSFAIGYSAKRLLRLPDWTLPTILFNNATSYPLMLIEALRETGILSALDGSGSAIDRASSYFLIYATVSNCVTFSIGPRLIDTEHAADSDSDSSSDGGSDEAAAHADIDPDEETGLLLGAARERGSRSAIPPRTKNRSHGPRELSEIAKRKAYYCTKKYWDRLGPGAQWVLQLVADFVNAPLLGAIIGAILGLSPPLQRAFFSPTSEGGIFTAWLTAALKKIGGLFVTLPVLVAGVSLYCSVMQTKGRSAGSGHWKLAFAVIILVRFVLWPIMSISAVYTLARHTTLVGSDPILWFTMCLMPTGAPATKLLAMAQVSDSDEESQSGIAKTMTLSYLVSPILSFTVVAALEASKSAMR